MADSKVVDPRTGLTVEAVTQAGGMTYRPAPKALSLGARTAIMRRNVIALLGLLPTDETYVPPPPKPEKQRCGEPKRKGGKCRAWATSTGKCVGHSKQKVSA